MDESIREDLLSKRPSVSPVLWVVLLSLFFVGAAAFIANASKADNSTNAWQIFLINFVFWTGIAQAGIVFSCALRITQARWGRPLLRVSESLGSFLPVSFILLLIFLFIGKGNVLPYINNPYPFESKKIWLDPGFLVGRHIIAFGVLFILSFYYLYYSLRQDLGGVGDKLTGMAAWVASGWRGEDEKEEIWKKLIKLAPAVALVYTITSSFIGWDFMMALDEHWFSTMFGPYYFMASILGAVGMTIVLSSYLRKHMNLFDYISDNQYWDIGKILIGFSMFWVYLMFAQYLTIWYGNMPEETGFVIARTQTEPFKTLSWVVLSCCFFFPFVSLIPRSTKVITPLIVFISMISLAGLWLEKFVLIVPSVSHVINFGWVDILVTTGFASAFVLTFLLFIKTFPAIPVGDPLFGGKVGKAHGGH